MSKLGQFLSSCFSHAQRVFHLLVGVAFLFLAFAGAHVSLAEPVCPTLARHLGDSIRASGLTVHAGGTYLCIDGPAFSTRAESALYRSFGVDVIGMTAMPEAKLAKEAEMAYALVALVTDYDCWKKRPADQTTDPAALMREIIGHLQVATANAMTLIRRALDLAAARQADLMNSPSLHALQLAIWSNKAQIAADEVLRLTPIWGRYFQPRSEERRVSGCQERGAANAKVSRRSCLYATYM